MNELQLELEKLVQELKEVRTSMVFLEMEYMDIKERIIKFTKIINN
jgi:predicted  nucleic acid-binding Zn-ribbon protein